jgi:hypothetical protein
VATTIHQRPAAMAADIVKCADAAITVAGQDHITWAKRHRHPLARRTQLVHGRGMEPNLRPQPQSLQIRKVLFCIANRWNDAGCLG